MKKKIIIISLGTIFLIIAICLTMIVINNGSKNKGSVSSSSEIRKEEIPDNYIAVFHGGSGEVTYETYIYKIDNGHDNYGFKYINVTSHTQKYGSSKWTHKITDRGEFDWTDDAFSIAKKNNAYSYVTEPNNDKIYSIEEYQSRFIMN